MNLITYRLITVLPIVLNILVIKIVVIVFHGVISNRGISSPRCFIVVSIIQCIACVRDKTYVFLLALEQTVFSCDMILGRHN